MVPQDSNQDDGDNDDNKGNDEEEEEDDDDVIIYVDTAAAGYNDDDDSDNDNVVTTYHGLLPLEEQIHEITEDLITDLQLPVFLHQGVDVGQDQWEQDTPTVCNHTQLSTSS